MTCRDPQEMVKERLDRVLTQYRESPKLLWMIQSYLASAITAHQQICDLPEKLDIETATGDQLTMIGKRLGWPRCHCVCTSLPVFGFDCAPDDDMTLIAGLCEDNSTWRGCADEFGVGELCINDDELYRKFLKVRRRQFLRLYHRESLEDAIKMFWGPQARILDAGHGRIVVAPGRELTGAEKGVLQLYPRVLPVQVGVQIRFHFGPTLNVFGFGEGWGELCDAGQGPLETEDNEPLETETGEELTTESSVFGSIWMCEIDVKPYSC